MGLKSVLVFRVDDSTVLSDRVTTVVGTSEQVLPKPMVLKLHSSATVVGGSAVVVKDDEDAAAVGLENEPNIVKTPVGSGSLGERDIS